MGIENNIKSYALTIAVDSKNPATAKKAKECISQLTSGERKCLLEILYPPPNPKYKKHSDQLEIKLQKINDGSDSIANPKPTHMGARMARVIKNVIGTRKSTDQIIDKLKQYESTHKPSFVESAKAQIDVSLNTIVEKFSKESLDLCRAICSRDDAFDKEDPFIRLSDYETIGVEPGISLEELEAAYVKCRKENEDDPEEINDIDISFKNLYAIENAFQNLQDKDSPRTLKSIFEKGDLEKGFKHAVLLSNMYTLKVHKQPIEKFHQSGLALARKEFVEAAKAAVEENLEGLAEGFTAEFITKLKESCENDTEFNDPNFLLIDEYEVLGVRPGVSIEKLDEAYIEFLDTHLDDEGFPAYQGVYCLEKASQVLFPNNTPRTLKAAFEKWEDLAGQSMPEEVRDEYRVRMASVILLYMYKKRPELR